MEQFIRHLMFDVLSKKTIDKVLKLVRKLDWEDEQVGRYVEAPALIGDSLNYCNRLSNGFVRSSPSLGSWNMGILACLPCLHTTFKGTIQSSSLASLTRYSRIFDKDSRWVLLCFVDCGLRSLTWLRNVSLSKDQSLQVQPTKNIDYEILRRNVHLSPD